MSIQMSTQGHTARQTGKTWTLCEQLIPGWQARYGLIRSAIAVGLARGTAEGWWAELAPLKGCEREFVRREIAEALGG